MKTTDFTKAFSYANDAVMENQSPLTQTFALRQLIRACEERITELSDDAVQQASEILSCEGRTQGEFVFNNLKFQLQRTEVYDFTNYNRYKGEDAIRWRVKRDAQNRAKLYSAALTRELKGIVDGFAATHPEWEPDEVKCIIKCIFE